MKFNLSIELDNEIKNENIAITIGWKGLSIQRHKQQYQYQYSARTIY